MRPRDTSTWELFSVRQPGQPKPKQRNDVDPARAECHRKIELLREAKELEAECGEIWDK